MKCQQCFMHPVSTKGPVRHQASPPGSTLSPTCPLYPDSAARSNSSLPVVVSLRLQVGPMLHVFTAASCSQYEGPASPKTALSTHTVRFAGTGSATNVSCTLCRPNPARSAHITSSIDTRTQSTVFRQDLLSHTGASALAYSSRVSHARRRDQTGNRHRIFKVPAGAKLRCVKTSHMSRVIDG